MTERSWPLCNSTREADLPVAMQVATRDICQIPLSQWFHRCGAHYSFRTFWANVRFYPRYGDTTLSDRLTAYQLRHPHHKVKPLLYPTSETEIVRLRRENEKLKHGKEAAEAREDEKWREKEELVRENQSTTLDEYLQHCYTYLYQNFKLADKSIVLNGAYKGLMASSTLCGYVLGASLRTYYVNNRLR